LADLKNEWLGLTAKYTEDKSIQADFWSEIEQAYSQPNRHYHNLEHLAYMMQKVDEYDAQIQQIDCVKFAVFYHDFIYSATSKNNEDRSAETAGEKCQKLGLSEQQIAKCQTHILATKSHAFNKDMDTNYLIDIDLGIIGESIEMYEAYAKKIRQEYIIFPDFLYKPGRKKVLEHFLHMDSIYKTTEFQKAFESQARKNLRWELDNL